MRLTESERLYVLDDKPKLVQASNAGVVPIKPWNGDMEDRELKKMKYLFEKVARSNRLSAAQTVRDIFNS